MAQLAQQVLRGYGDRVGRGRMRQDTTLRPDYPPRGMAVVTAEGLITGASSAARLFPVELQPHDVVLEKLTRAQQNSSHLGRAMVGYLGWLATEMSAGVSDRTLSRLFSERRADAERLSVHGRQSSFLSEGPSGSPEGPFDFQAVLPLTITL